MYLEAFPERITIMSAKLFIGNLSPDTTSDELRDLLSDVGGVEWCHLLSAQEAGRSQGYAFVKMDSLKAVNAAREKFNGQDLNGRELKLEQAENEKPGDCGCDFKPMF
jgi:RNA recognition motif-containing protein